MRRVARFGAFSAVGLFGVGVQLGALWAFVGYLDLPYLVATAAAVELTILHNFFWHRWWTWRDRPASEWQWFVRLIRFHVANGLISIGGNVGLMWLLAGSFHLPYLAANLMAIGVCSIVNFFASDDYVFKPVGRNLSLFFLLGSPGADVRQVPIDGCVAASRPRLGANAQRSGLQ